MRFIEQQNATGIDLVITFVSYEQRSVRLVTDICGAGYAGPVLAFYCEDSPSEALQTNLASMRTLLKDRLKVQPISCRNPISIIQATGGIAWPDSVLIDVSCFNRGNLFPFLWASGLGISRFPNTLFAYAAPLNYGDWLSRDYERPHNMLGYAGGLTFPEAKVLICLVGYEVERVLEVIGAAEPSKVILAVGDKPTREEFITRNKQAVKEVVGSNDYDTMSLDVSHPQSALAALDATVGSQPGGTAVEIAPFTSKLACLGVWALWLANKDIRVWNAQPREYNVMGYSQGSAAPRFFEAQWHPPL